MLKKYERALKAFQYVVAVRNNLAPAAQLYSAKALKALGRHEEASEELERLLQSSPPEGIAKAARDDQKRLDKIEDTEDAALKAYQSSDFRAAEGALQTFPDEELSADGRILLGMIYLNERKYTQAALTFEQTKRLPGLSEDKKNLVAELLKRARHNESQIHPYWFNVDVSYGTTNNAYADGESISAVSSPLTRIQMGLGYHFNQKKKWSEKISYTLYQENPEKAPEAEILNQTLQGRLLYQNSNFDFALAPYFQTQAWARSLVGQKTGVFLKGVLTKDPFDYGLEVDSSNQQSKNSDYSYFKGPATSIRSFLGWWDRDIYAQVFWLFGTDGIEDITYSDGSILPLNQKYQGPGLRVVWKPSDQIASFLWLSSLQRTYDHASMPVSKERKDQELNGSLKLAYYATPALSFYQLTEWISNKSTLGASDVRDKNYQVLVLTAGLSWDVF